MNKTRKRSFTALIITLAALLVLVLSLGTFCACGTNANGKNSAAAWLQGESAPTAEFGKEGDHYFDTETLTAYTMKNGEWVATNLYKGTGAPDNSQGEPGELYLDTANGVLYEKGTSVWSVALTLKGEPGRAGVMWFSGDEADPNTYGEGDTTVKDAIPGDFYLDTKNFEVWQKNAEGTWDDLGSLNGGKGDKGDEGDKGDQGPIGPEGPKGQDGNLWFYGTVAPEDAGLTAKAGDFYMRSLPSYTKAEGGIYNGYKIYVYQAEAEGGWWKQVIDQSPCTFLGVGHEFGADNLCKYCGLENVFAAAELHDEAGGSYTIKGAPAGVKELIIPHEIGGKNVTLEPGAFTDNTDLVSVVVEEGFTELANTSSSPTRWGIFEGCTNLASVTLPSTLTIIHRRAFYGCSSLKEITVPANVTFIGDGAFHNSGLESVQLSEGLQEIDKEAFRGTPLKSVVIPDSVTKIGYLAFANCTKLESVKIGNGLAKIEGDGGGNNPGGVFYDCENLLSVELGSSVAEIGPNAFEYCYRLVEVLDHSDSSVAKTKAAGAVAGDVGYYAAEIRLGDDATESRITTDGDYKFYTTKAGKKYLVNFVGEGDQVALILPDDGEEYEIYNYAFYKNKQVTDVTFGNSVTAIGEYAFAETRLGYYKGYYYFSIAGSPIEEYATPKEQGNIKSIGAHAFENAITKSNTTVCWFYIADTVESIGEAAFAGCSSLQKVYIGGIYNSDRTSSTDSSRLTSIGEDAFKDCYTIGSNFYFRNTTEAWKAATEGKNIFSGNISKNLSVVCNDGTLDKSGDAK